MKKKEKVIVICPGRGSYHSEELGYLKQHRPYIDTYLNQIDEYRLELGQKKISELDEAEKFQRSVHTKGENISGLIYICAIADFWAIDSEKYEIVAITGNSMGWYIAMACAGALNPMNAFKLINQMGSMMKNGNIGAQIIYPIMDEKWCFSQKRYDYICDKVKKINLLSDVHVFFSIFLGGNVVLGANDLGAKILLKELAQVKIGRIEYPFQLANHAAFHTPLLKEISKKAFELLGLELFQPPKKTLIDGRGTIWRHYNTPIKKLRDYTLGTQVYDTYNFTAAITTGLKEFCPDRVVLLGPGGNLGSSIGQILVANKWKGISCKEDFLNMQKENPFLISMGRRQDRYKVAKY